MKRIVYFVFLLTLWIFCSAPSCGGGKGVRGDNPPAGDTTAPTVLSTYPANNAIGVATNTIITVNFSEDMDPATITASTSTPDTDPPTVISTNPISNATDVATDIVITATFSEKMDVNTPYLIVQKDVEPPLGGTLSYSDLTNTVTFVPSQALIGNTTYTATVLSQSKDLAGNNMASDYIWSFTTKAPVPKLYVGNERSSGPYTTVSRIDPSDNSSINIDIDENIGGYGSPVNVAVNANKDKAYVVMFDSMVHAVHVIKTGTDTKGSPIDISEAGAFPQGGVVDPNTDYLYVSTKLNDIRVINGTTGAPIATISNVTACGYMLLNSGVNELYCLAGNNADTVGIINTIDNTVKATITVGSGPNGAVVDYATNLLYISNGYSHTISVIDLTTYAVADTIALTSGDYPWGLAIDGGTMYIVAWGQDKLMRMNLVTKTITGSALTGGDGPLYLVLYNGKAYITNWGAWYSGEVVCDNKVSVINLSTLTLETTIPVGDCPLGLDIYIP
ncbi:MAG: Ig-like domain-containing protein [Candidatus Terrybacteria bacterium]|nr:Ig-like domain-containing protein [Candidatus Terrybacteria bacterium]